jgi:VWFA-related protein
MRTPILAGLVVATSLATLIAGPSPDAARAAHAERPDAQARTAGSEPQATQSFKFKTNVELINVSATVLDRTERFVPHLRKEDFALWEDGRPQPITHFSDERVPVSLGILLDTSGSMEGDKFQSAEAAINRFLRDLSPDDEVFLYTFDDEVRLVQPWTRDRNAVADALGGVRPRGGTSMYDAVAEAIPLAQRGHNRKRAIVVISDGNDTNSRTEVQALRSLIRETEVLIYAIGIDGDSPSSWTSSQPRWPVPFPYPPGGRPPGPQWPGRPQPPPSQPRWPGGGSGGNSGTGRYSDRVNVQALRDLTDDSGGRTEVVREARDLGPATRSIADELSQQYSLAYTPAAPKDGRWHTIQVEVKNPDYRVRARRGYIATP